jgi:hypothetical protein
MRHLAAERCTSLYPTISIVNPACVPEDTNTCPHFRPIRKIRVAWGIGHLLDRIPYGDAKVLKSQILTYFGKNNYYRFYRKERGIPPEEQEIIRQLFRKKGISEEITFDGYTEEYQWD